MSESATELRSTLLRQRRFLILTSLAVIAFYALGVGVKNEAEYSGFVLTLDRPDRVVVGLWLIWGWAVWRYAQRVYELLSVIGDELLDDVYAEDRRIALTRARKVGNQLAAEGHFDEIPKSARVRDRVTIEPPSEEDWKDRPDGEKTTHFRDFFPTRQGGRKYPTLTATFDWVEGTKWGSVDERFKMELTRYETLWLRARAWIHSLLRLPAFSEHIAPLLIAASVVVVWLLHQCRT